MPIELRIEQRWDTVSNGTVLEVRLNLDGPLMARQHISTAEAQLRELARPGYAIHALEQLRDQLRAALDREVMQAFEPALRAAVASATSISTDLEARNRAAMLRIINRQIDRPMLAGPDGRPTPIDSIFDEAFAGSRPPATRLTVEALRAARDIMMGTRAQPRAAGAAPRIYIDELADAGWAPPAQRPARHEPYAWVAALPKAARTIKGELDGLKYTALLLASPRAVWNEAHHMQHCIWQNYQRRISIAAHIALHLDFQALRLTAHYAPGQPGYTLGIERAPGSAVWRQVMLSGHANAQPDAAAQACAAAVCAQFNNLTSLKQQDPKHD